MVFLFLQTSYKRKMEISLIIPIYNAEQYLQKTLSDLQNQSYQDFEVILVDDLSQDGSIVVADRFCTQDKRFRIVRNDENLGAACSRNRGLEKASGRFVMFLDSDDRYYPTLLENLHRNIIKYEADIAMCRSNIIDQRTGKRRTFGQWKRLQPFFDKEGIWVVDNLREQEGASSLIDLVAWNKLIRRDWLQITGIKFQNLPSYNDLYFSMSATLLAKRVVFLNEILIDYYQFHSGSITEQRRQKNCGIVKAYAAVLRRKQIKDSKIASELRNRAMHNMIAVALTDNRDWQSKVELFKEIMCLYETDWRKLKTEWDPICSYYLRKIKEMGEKELAYIDSVEFSAQVIAQLLHDTVIFTVGIQQYNEAEKLKKVLLKYGREVEIIVLPDEPDAFWVGDGCQQYERKQVCL